MQTASRNLSTHTHSTEVSVDRNSVLPAAEGKNPDFSLSLSTRFQMLNPAPLYHEINLVATASAGPPRHRVSRLYRCHDFLVSLLPLLPVCVPRLQPEWFLSFKSDHVTLSTQNSPVAPSHSARKPKPPQWPNVLRLLLLSSFFPPLLLHWPPNCPLNIETTPTSVSLGLEHSPPITCTATAALLQASFSFGGRPWVWLSLTSLCRRC